MEENKEYLERDTSILKKRKEHIQDRLDKLKFSWTGGGFIALVVTIIPLALKEVMGEGIQTHPNLSSYIAYIVPRLFLTLIIGFLGYLFLLSYIRAWYNINLRKIDMELTKLGADELQEKIEENFFTKLVQINFKYLDQYYLQTQEQADKSFRLCSFAALGGFILISLGIVMMLLNKIEPAYLTTIAGVLSEFIAAVFFYLYNKTILKMSEYHQKLVITQNISLALKISDDMPLEEKNKALSILIDRLTTDVNKYLTNSKE